VAPYKKPRFIFFELLSILVIILKFLALCEDVLLYFRRVCRVELFLLLYVMYLEKTHGEKHVLKSDSSEVCHNWSICSLYLS